MERDNTQVIHRQPDIHDRNILALVSSEHSMQGSVLHGC